MCVWLECYHNKCDSHVFAYFGFWGQGGVWSNSWEKICPGLPLSLSLLCSIAHVCPFRMLPVSIALEPTTFQQTTHGLPSDASDASKSPFTLMGFKSPTEISKVHRILGGIVRSRFATHHVGHQICVLQCLYLSLSISLSLSPSRRVRLAFAMSCSHLSRLFCFYKMSRDLSLCALRELPRPTFHSQVTLNKNFTPSQPCLLVLSSMRIPLAGAFAIKRAAKFTASPSTVYSMPSQEPFRATHKKCQIHAFIFTFSRTIFGPAICPSKCSSSIYSKSHQSPSEEAVAANRQQLERYSKGGHNIVEKLIYHVRHTSIIDYNCDFIFTYTCRISYNIHLCVCLAKESRSALPQTPQ